MIAATPPAIQAPASPRPGAAGARSGTPPATALDWMLDDELAGRAKAAHADALAQNAAAAGSEKQRAAEAAKLKAATDEKEQLQASSAPLTGKKKSQADLRIAELEGIAKEADSRVTRFAGEAAAARGRAAADESFAARAEAEDRLRTAQAADRIDPDGELADFSDDKLAKAKAWWKREADRAPSQLAAIEKQIDADQTQGGRAALLNRADSVRGLQKVAAAQIERLDEELRYRSETKADESQQAAALVAAVKAKASETPMEAMTMTTARSAALDRKLEEIAAVKDREAADADSFRRTRKLILRIGAAVGTFAAAVILIFVMLKRSNREAR